MNENEENFSNYLSKRLKNNLPGFEAHKKMLPFQSNERLKKFQAPETAKKSSVLILLDEVNNTKILLTIRSNKLRSHRGQISFPGGKAEKGESPEQTALRETNEEIGLTNSDFKLIGSLSSIYVPPSNSFVTPFIAKLMNNNGFTINPDEVEEIFFTNIDYLCDEENIKHERTTIENKTINIPYWDIHPKVKLWGATAIILSELCELYKEFKSQYT